MFSSSDRSSASEAVWISDCQRICGDHAEHLCQPLLFQQWLPLGARVLVLGEERVHPGSEQSQLRLYAQGFPSRNSGPKPNLIGTGKALALAPSSQTHLLST